MPIDDNFDPNDFMDFEDDPAEFRREMEAHFRRFESLPIVKKAQEISELTKFITETAKESDAIADEEPNEYYFQEMLNDANDLESKLAWAENTWHYSSRMEKAVLIKVSARSLLDSTGWLLSEGLTPPEYVELLRNAIDEFRLLFIDWVAGFNRTDDITDEWGPLFS